MVSPQEVSSHLLRFAKQPLVEIANLPKWDWKFLIILNVALSALCGMIAGFVPFNIYNVFTGLLVTPIICLSMTVLLSLFVFYYFQIFEKRTVSFERLFELTTFANIPFFVFQIGSFLLPPITIIALAFNGLLMVVGLAENFQLPKNRAIRLIAVLYVLVFVVWLWNKIDTMRLESL